MLDTSVWVAGLRSSTGASYAVLRAVRRRWVMPLVGTALFLEYEAVLKRPEQRLEHGLSIEMIDRLLNAFAKLAEPVDRHFTWRPQLTDPSDEMVLETAVNGRADAIVTHNVRDFLPAAAKFGVLIATPGAILRMIRQ